MKMNYDEMTRAELIALSQRPDVEREEKEKISEILAKRPPTQVLTDAGGVTSQEKIGKL
jgi:hypothetical protein